MIEKISRPISRSLTHLTAPSNSALIASIPFRPHRSANTLVDSMSNGDQNSSGSNTNKQPTTSPASIPWSKLNKPESATPKRQIKPPSPSASIILVSPTNKVLLLHRVQTSSAFPSAHVFPGGNLEPSDGTLPESPTDPARHSDSIAYRTAAIRELFEESGILLARETSSSTSSLLSLSAKIRLQGRHDIHSHMIEIKSWLSSQAPSAVLDTEALIPFTRWITPTNVPKRFTTQMYLYFLPVSMKDTDSLIATSDEIETMAPEWRAPHTWISRARSGKIILFPPQFLLLGLVSQFLDLEHHSPTKSTSQSPPPSDHQLEERRDQLRKFVHEDGSPPWTDKIISPTALSFTRKDGRSVLGLDKPGPELRGVAGIKGDDTRVVLVRFSEAGPRDVEVRMRKEVMAEERIEKDEGASKL